MKNNIKFILASLTLLFFAACTESPTTPQIGELEMEQEVPSLNTADVNAPNEIKEREYHSFYQIIPPCVMPTIYNLNEIDNVFDAYADCTSFPQVDLPYVNCSVAYVHSGWGDCVRRIYHDEFPMSGPVAQALYDEIIDCLAISNINCPEGDPKTVVSFGQYYTYMTNKQWIVPDYVLVECCEY